MDKPFKTFDEQVKTLNGTAPNSKKRVDTDLKTKIHLMRNNYYTMVNFYNKPFLKQQNTDIYHNNVHFNEIKALHDFDKDLRVLFFNVLTQVETSLKTAIAYYFSEKYINQKEPYLNPNNYFMDPDYKNAKNISSIILKLISYKRNKKKLVISHYLKKDNIPLWVLINFLTFGEISTLFSLLHKPVQDNIIRHFRTLYLEEYNNKIPGKINIKFLETFFKACNDFRNISAHNERFYNHTLIDHIATSPVSTLQNQARLFSLYENLELFLTKAEFENLTINLKKYLCILEKKLASININIILKEMDFPSDWHK